MELTKGQLIGLFNTMSAIKEQLASKSITSTSVYYPISRNLKTIKNEIDSLMEVDPQKFQHEFNEERTVLAEAKCKRDEEGKPILVTDDDGRQMYDIEDGVLKELEVEIASLWEDKYAKDYLEAMVTFEELLKEEVEVNLININSKNLINKLPDLSVELIDNLLRIIED